ncbi:ATP-dependent zinc metalloprotease FtsH [Longimicrobium sp.]|uniref:ATP-dependent zinc metalloprotease FtsH n=1 Tax=Longimicrobium sp. TaxID=2029185 RepID=UPI002C037885|nr:ATP-dependent zinc metalloprotease FtsH [Longimicrobium sp.]HSU15683.1 ATP-dependent zinc metalloprotease FtsH [Longimicrobium sp.]
MEPPIQNERRRGTDRRRTGGLGGPGRFGVGPLLIGFLALIALTMLWGGAQNSGRIAYSELKNRIAAGQVEKVEITPTTIVATPRPAIADSARVRQWSAALPASFEDRELLPLLERMHVPYQGAEESKLWGLLVWLLPVAMIVVFWSFMMRRMNPTQGVLTVGKSKARIVGEEGTGVTFQDVAGVDEARQETQEIVEFLRSPEKFAKLGAKIPKGVLLVGPPGTGKTLLARAVAGEAGVTFFQLSGAEFVEMFVGVGAARVRDLFAQAKAQAPCIIFIDELDALGKARTPGGVLGGNDEREQTLNQLLVEMDGFDPRMAVIIMAATNRPEILDPALLRPGRFDRQILVDRPDVKGRLDILRIHSRGVSLGQDVDLERIARRTPGFVGADLANLLNEAALLAARRDKSEVSMLEIDDAVDRIVAGLEKKNRLINDKERTIVAYHEAGHAIVAERVPTADPVHKISIIPRGVAALGYTQQLPTEDRYLLQKQELMDRIAVLLGGRVAEEIVFNEISTGAGNDLERVTELARSMVMEYGMSRELGPVNLSGPRRMQFLQADGDHGGGRQYSEETARQIDSEIRGLIDGTYERVRRILTDDRGVLEVLAQRLLEKEVVDEAELREIMNLPPRTREPSEDRIVTPPPASPIGEAGQARAASSAADDAAAD